MILTGLLILAAAYLLGAIPFGFLLVRWKTGRDVRSMGSGNIGATNVLRTTGRGLGLLTLALDILKGAAAVWAASRFTGGDPFWMSLAALAVIAGHAYPVFLGFRGGKAVASFLGAWLVLAPVAVLAVTLLFGIVVAVSRYISLGSILAAGSFPLAVWLILHPPGVVLAAALISGAFIVWRHKSNIERLRAGAENVFRFGSAKK